MEKSCGFFPKDKFMLKHFRNHIGDSLLMNLSFLIKLSTAHNLFTSLGNLFLVLYFNLSYQVVIFFDAEVHIHIPRVNTK